MDPGSRTARVGPGATLGDLDHETQAFGLATPLGINSTTGVAGLTLGGGFGWLTRKLGMTADNLRAADVVTADGELLHTGEQLEPDLLWGLRGGGGNLGVVTSFEFRLHLGGAAGRVPVSATAYPHREASFFMNVHARWESRQEDEACTAWARKVFDAMAPYATGGTYVNFMSEDDERARAAYGANYERLARLKARYDPTDLFRMNQNVPPAAGA